MLVWNGGGVDFFDLSWVESYVLVEHA
jgi:hypothetical protein